MRIRHIALFVSLWIVASAAPAAAATASGSASSTTASFLSTAAPVQSSRPISAKLESWSPRAGAVGVWLFGYIDTARVYSADLLARQSTAAGRHLPGTTILKPMVKDDAQAQKFSWAGVGQSILGVLVTVYFYILVVLRSVIVNVALCYVALAAALIFGTISAIRFLRR